MPYLLIILTILLYVFLDQYGHYTDRKKWDSVQCNHVIFIKHKQPEPPFSSTKCIIYMYRENMCNIICVLEIFSDIFIISGAIALMYKHCRGPATSRHLKTVALMRLKISVTAQTKYNYQNTPFLQYLHNINVFKKMQQVKALLCTFFYIFNTYNIDGATPLFVICVWMNIYSAVGY